MLETRQFLDKHHFTPNQNNRFAQVNLTKLVHTSARFEGVNTTLSQTQKIMDGVSVKGVPNEDVLTIINLEQGWQYVIIQNEPLTLGMEKHINKIVAAEDALVPGELRQGQGGISLGQGVFFEPPLIEEQQEDNFLQDVLANTEITVTDKALTVMYHNMRQQIFWDGNKRTAVLSANKVMIAGGAGLINVPLNKWDVWNKLISDYYQTSDISTIKQWTYEHAIQGFDVKC